MFLFKESMAYSVACLHTMCHTLHSLDPASACTYVCKYVDQNGLAAMLASKRTAGVSPKVNLSNLLHASDEAHKPGIYSGFETPDRHHQQAKKGVSK